MYAVIGAGYGDEGKGLATDFLADLLQKQGKSPLVVRGNGGAQAGHTVVTPEGQRHVFGHLGAGSFVKNTSTYLAENFLINPVVLAKEIQSFPGAQPYIIAHPRCRVTTIFDMAINALVELSRGNGRHGSCGMGINETVTRHERGFSLVFSDMHKIALGTTTILSDIKNNWVPQRLAELGLTRESVPDGKVYFDALEHTNVDAYAKDIVSVCYKFLFHAHPDFRNRVFGTPIYEGAQGLMLDEFLGKFPHVTRSITGLASAIKAAHELGINEVQPVYMTRCYVTRHGAGPLRYEGEKFCDTSIQDLTNVDNQWQGSIRYAPLDLLSLVEIINEDMLRAECVSQLFGVKIKNPMLGVTCLDQVGQEVLIRNGRNFNYIPTNQAAQFIADSLELTLAFESWGPTRKDVRIGENFGV